VTAAHAQPLLDAIAAAGFAEIARSSQGRAIGLGRFGPASSKARLLVLGGVHGDEPASVAAVLAFARGLAAAPPPVAVLVIPCANPDGLAAGTKNTSRDVDLNRNFPAANFTSTHATGYDPGPEPLCEPEARAVAAVVDGERPSHVVAVHAPLSCVNFDGPAAAWAAAVSAACGWPARADIGYPTPGSLGSWLGRDRGLPVLTVELPHGPYDAFAVRAAAALGAALAQVSSEKPAF